MERSKTIGAGAPGNRNKGMPRACGGIRMIGACAAALFVLLAALLLVLVSRSGSEQEVKARYDGQTYYGQSGTGSSYGQSYGNGGWTSKSEFAMAPENGIAASTDAMAPEAAAGSSYGTGGSYDAAYDDSSVGQHGLKLAYYYDFSCETTEYDAFLEGLEEHVSGIGGYIESSSSDARNYDRIGSRGILTVRKSNYSIRVPAGQIQAFRSYLSDGADVTGSSVRMRDRTEAYADADLQARSYRAEYEKLEAMIPAASSVSELIEIQDRLSDLNYQIQWAERQKDLIDEDVEMSSVSLTVYEVEYYMATVKSYRFEMGERIAEAFEDFLYTAPYFMFAMVYLMIGGFVVIGLCSVLFRVLFSIRNKKSQEQTIRLVRDQDAYESDAGREK